jgi:hypothetical protein
VSAALTESDVDGEDGGGGQYQMSGDGLEAPFTLDCLTGSFSVFSKKLKSLHAPSFRLLHLVL